MANSLTALSPTFWSKILGRKVYKHTVFRSIASFEEQKTLSYGRVVDRPYRSNVAVEDYSKGTAATAQDLTATSDTLTINKQKTVLMYVDDVDKLQNKWDSARVWAEEAGERLAINMDAELLYEGPNSAGDTIDDGDIGGSAGTRITLTASNIANVVAKINRKLDVNNVDMTRSKRFWVISPQMYDVLWSYIQGKETLLGDKTGEFGNIGRYGGLELYISNNLTGSARWTPADDPSNTATITIGGVTFTFVSSIGSTAGNVLIDGTVAGTLDNLVALINDPSTTSATQVGFSGADLRTVQEMVAVDGTTYIDVYHKGASFPVVTTSESADVWSLETQHSVAGVKGAVDMVVQKEPDVRIADTVSAGKRGVNIMPLCVFGVKTFNQGANEILDVQVDSSSY